MTSFKALSIATALALGVAGAVSSPVAAAPAPAPLASPASTQFAPPDIPSANAWAHAQAFQTIATNNGGNRAHGRPGYRASVDYVKGKLDAAGFTTTLQSFTHNGATGWNVIADWPQGDPNQIAFQGAHLDGVTAGAGINDNASGSSAILEVALAVSRAQLKPQKRLRFGWWGAEELGLIGSRYYANSLPSSERTKIKSYLNYDMVGAKGTTTWGVYNDNANLQRTMETYFRGKGLPTRPFNIGARSDHASFKNIGVPVSGIASGNDPCYHSRCDTITNITQSVLGTATNAAAYGAWTLAGAPGMAEAESDSVLPASAPADSAEGADPRIVGGGFVAENKPWIGALLRGSSFTCTSAQIAPQWVLTAAHCVESGSGFQVRIGSLNRTSGGTLASVSQVVKHPQYSWPAHDIALLKLASPVTNTYAPLATSADLKVGQALTLYGWGSEKQDWSGPLPTKLKYADGTLSSTACHSSSAPLVCTQTNGTVAGGDSGGPVFVKSAVTGQLVHAGVCAVGRKPATGGWAGYTSTATHRTWIKQTSGV